ncbi:MAG TPA: SPOR domain-containing protein [Thermoanaerobaculia bacterium]|nr:SPOR domain-containing protein [Thermoanaerobaculia bacterium]
MAESHEPSYYEIALTNRQVIVAFVVLLVCLLSAFFSGVWIGRESGARAAEQQVVRNTPPQAPPEGQNLEELEFFGSGKAAEKAADSDAQETAPPAVDTTLLEDVEGRRPAAPASPGDIAGEEIAEEDEPAPAAVAPIIPDPAAERRNRRNKRREAAEAAAALAAKAPAPAPAPARTARTPVPAAPAVPKGSVVIQVFSSADRSQADRIRGQLAGGGYKAYLSPIEKAGRTMYRVRIGPYPSRDDAQKAAEKVRTGYKLDTWVTE